MLGQLLIFCHIKYLIFSFVFSLGVCLKIVQPVDSDLARVGSKISSKYFAQLNSILLVTEEDSTGNGTGQTLNLSQFNSYFNVLVDKRTEDSCYVPLLYNILETAFEEGCTGFIVQLSRPLCFLRAWKHVALTSPYRHNPRVLFLPTVRIEIISKEILGSNLTQFIFDTTVVDIYKAQSSDSENSFQLVTSDWSSKSHVLVDCKASECANNLDNLYPDKMANLEAKEMTVATFGYPPYAILSPQDGTEIRIAEEYARLHNCSIKIVTDDAQWGNIYDNGTGDGILGNVAEEKADVGLGALYLWYHEYQSLDYSVPYIRTGITCLAPRPTLLSKVLLPIQPFTLVTWLILVAALIVSCAALYVTKKLDIILIDSQETDEVQSQSKRHHQWFTTKADTALRTFGFILLQAYANRTVEATSIRHLVNWLHIFCLLVATSYNSGLASILTVPSYLPPIDSVTDLVNSKLHWGATHDAWIFSLREATDIRMTTLVGRFRALPKETLISNSFSADFAFSIERLPAGHFAIGDYITEDSVKYLRLMKEDIYYEHCIIVFQKGSPYLKSFNHLIHQLLNSGLLLFWEGEVARKFLNTRVQSGVKESTTLVTHDYLLSIQLSHCQGAFIILAAGLIAGFVVFIGELYVTYKHRPKPFPLTKNSKIKSRRKLQIGHYNFYVEVDRSY